MTPHLPDNTSPAARLWSVLLDWRSSPSFGRLESILLAVYLFVLAITIPHHEPWADEAQAWVIARDNSIWQILRYRLHYEGSPGLWHIFLHLFQALGGRYGAIDYFGAAFATAGIIVFLRWSPFPLLVRVLLPFTFFLQYQYAVIGRSYTLFPLLAFCLCALFYSRRNPVWFALVAGLLANLSLQGTIYSFFLLILYLFHRYRRSESQLEETGDRSRRLLRPVAIYLAFFAVAAFSAVPAPDCGIANGPPVTTGIAYRLLQYYPGLLPPSEKLPAQPVSDDTSLLLPVPPPLPPEPTLPKPHLLHSPGAWALWYINHDEYDSPGRVRPRRFTQPLLEVVIELLSLATAPLSTLKLLASLFLVILASWLWVRRSLSMLLPWLANLIVGEALWIADHHTGMLFLCLLTAIWLSIQMPAGSRTSHRVISRNLDWALMLLLAVICALQITWTAVSIHNDVHKIYDPGPETAAFLLQHPRQRMAAFDFEAVGVQPYFPQNPFYNLRHSYWVWATNDNPNGAHLATLEQHPDLVLFSEDLLDSGLMHNDWVPLSPVTARTQDRDLPRNPIILDLQVRGYRETHRFCGDRFMRLKASYRGCDLIFEPAGLRELGSTRDH